MDNKKLLTTGIILDDMAVSIRNIIYASFPGTSLQEREDIEQEAKLKIWRMISNGKNIDNFRSYLWKVVYTTALGIIEKRLQNMSEEEIQKMVDSARPARFSEAGPEFLCQNEEMKMELSKAIEMLPSRRRSVVRLWLSDMNLAEIAAYLGWGGNQVRHLLYRGIEEVKGNMAKRTGSASGASNLEEQVDGEDSI